MRRGSIIVACTAALLAGQAAVAQPAAPTPAASAPAAARTQHADAVRAVEAWLDAQAAFERLPSLAAGIVIGQELVWRQAWGHADHARRVPARSDTVYSICSIAKLFTSIAVMALWEDGRLSLDDDVGKWLPALALPRGDADGMPITLRTLLTHSSGLAREANFPYWNAPEFRFPTRDELLQGLAAQRTFMRASERYQYSNLGMAVLGEVVAAASGMAYEDFVRARILAPLQLADTQPALPGSRLAQGYGALRRDGTRDPLPPFDVRGLVAAAGFSSTVDDLARFSIWQFRLRKNGGREVLKASTLREMQRVHWTDPDGKNSWGLGFFAGRDGGVQLAGHNGICPGHLSTLNMALNEEVAIVLMASANDNRSLGRLAAPARRLLLKGLKLPVAPAGGPALDDYAGRYGEQPWNSETVVLKWGTGLAELALPSSDPAGDMTLLKHAGGDTFHALRDDGSTGAEVVFVRGADGRVTGARTWNFFAPKLPR